MKPLHIWSGFFDVCRPFRSEKRLTWSIPLSRRHPYGFLIMFTLYSEVENDELYAGAPSEGGRYFSSYF
ncbi:hypothetical protein ACE3MQ_19495 [Paenibacillus lentus]